MKIGPYTLRPVETGTLWLDGGAMFGTVPRVLWEQHHRPDDQNRIELAMRALLIEGEGKRILVDCGLGDKGGQKFKDMFGVEGSDKKLQESLGAYGISAADVTHVILTHLHFDHAGGATRRAPDGTWLPTFPNAEYFVQRKNLEVAKTPNARERASYLPENYSALVAADCLTQVDGSIELFPGIHLWVSQGHTESQQHVRVTDGQRTLFYGGDLIPTRAHVRLPWIAGYDLHPLTMLEEKDYLFRQAVDENWVLFYEHDPRAEASHVAKDARGYVAGLEIRL